MDKRIILNINSRDYWVKIVDFLQQNWALIDVNGDSTVTVFFIHDRSGVFDRLNFPAMTEAQQGLRKNGFHPLAELAGNRFVPPAPEPPFWDTTHPNGPIYSSGRFWSA